MSRVSTQVLARAIQAIDAMDLRRKEALVDEIFRAQPNMLSSILVLQRMGVSLAKIDFALHLLCICFQSMKESKLAWPLITQAEQDKQMARYVAAVRFGEDLPPAQRERAMMQYLNAHLEQPLLAYVTTELTKWMGGIEQMDSDKYVMLGCANLVNCIAFAPLPATVKKK